MRAISSKIPRMLRLHVFRYTAFYGERLMKDIARQRELLAEYRKTQEAGQ